MVYEANCRISLTNSLILEHFDPSSAVTVLKHNSKLFEILFLKLYIYSLLMMYWSFLPWYKLGKVETVN